jgi:hypothetical protein
MKTITEELPSSGAKIVHEHKWQRVPGESKHPDKDLYICVHEGCSAAKLVDKPKVHESKSEKPLLLG